MDIKDLEVRALVSAHSINCSKLDPEKFYTLKNPGLNTNGNSIISMEVDVYNDNKVFLGRVGLDNFVFGLNTDSHFSLIQENDSHRITHCFAVFVITSPLFPNIAFQYGNMFNPGPFEFNGKIYLIDKMISYELKEGSKITLLENHCEATFGLFDDYNRPIYLLDK